jgi:hypothetical protein
MTAIARIDLDSGYNLIIPRNSEIKILSLGGIVNRAVIEGLAYRNIYLWNKALNNSLGIFEKPELITMKVSLDDIEYQG